MKNRLLIVTCVERLSSRFRAARRAVLILAISVLGALTLAAQTDSVTLGKFEAHPTRILAKFKDRGRVDASAEPLKQMGSKVHHRYQLVPGLVALEEGNGAGAANVPASDEAARRGQLLNRIEALKKSGLFEYVEPDYIVHADLTPTDTSFVNGILWGLRNYGQTGGTPGADVGATNAWDLTTGSTEVIVAVIDTGVRYSHRDLTNQMWRNPGEIAGNGIDDDDNGYVDDVFGINAITDTGNPFDDNDHGTHCSGTIGASANDVNPHVGVTWHVQLMACKFLSGQGFGSGSDAIKCIDYAVMKGARILNNSWGGGGYSQALFDSINDARIKGVLFVAAAGNAAANNDEDQFYPANYPLDNVISVAALDRRDTLADFSNYGLTSVHVGAPGVEIYSSTAGSDIEYQFFQGTSMAAPHVCGVAALILSLYPTADLSELRDRILLGAVPIPALNGRSITGGRVNAYNSLTIAGSGFLQVSVDPPSGSTLLAGSAQPIFVKVTDLFAVRNATVTAVVAGVTNLTFANNGQSPDVLANDGIYSALFQVPNSTNPLTMTVTVTAPGKFGATNVVEYTVVLPPSNDNFTNATKVPAAGALYLSNNRFATKEPGEPNHAGVTTAVNSLWWSWSPASNTNAFIDTTGSSIDTVLAVYTGNSFASLQLVAATNDIGQRKQGYVSFSAQAGTAYHIAVASADTNSVGSLQLRVTPGGQPDTTPPQVFITSPLSGATVTDRVIIVTGTALDPAPNVTGVRDVLLSVNGAIASFANGTANWSAPALLRPGLNTLAARAIDAAGNSSPLAVIQITYFPNDPANDFFANAIALSGTNGASSVSNTNATKEVGEPIHAGNSGGKSVWWSFVAPADGVLVLATTNSTFDTLLGLYIGDRVTNLTTVASNDDAYDAVPGGFSHITQAVTSNQTYRIAVDGYDGVSGTVILFYSFTLDTIYHLSISSTAGGIVVPGSIDVASNSAVVVTAIPSENYVFDLWDGDVISLNNPLTVVVRSDMSLTAHFRPDSFTEDFESGNLLRLPWTTAGNAPWFVQTNTVFAGQYAARSGAISHSQTSSLLLTGNFRAGNGGFRFRVSSEQSWDFLKFYVDGALVQQWSGEINWTAFSFVLGAGTHTLEWRYSKDLNTSLGLDAAFIDNVSLPLFPDVNGTSPAFLQLKRQSDGAFYVELLGQTNQQYVIQVSTNLSSTNWENLATNFAANGIVRVADPASLTRPVQFYRALILVP